MEGRPKTWSSVLTSPYIKGQTPNPKCRLYWCLIEFIDGRYCQSCWYFRPLLWTVAPLPSLCYLPHPPSSRSKVNVQYIQTLCGCGVGGGVLSYVVDHILQEFNTLFLTSTPPQTKTPVKTTFRDWSLYSERLCTFVASQFAAWKFVEIDLCSCISLYFMTWCPSYCFVILPTLSSLKHAMCKNTSLSPWRAG